MNGLVTKYGISQPKQLRISYLWTVLARIRQHFAPSDYIIWNLCLGAGIL